MVRTGFLSIGSALVLATSIQANLDLAIWNTQTVKASATWASIETKINSISMDVEINRGVVTTVATVEYTPSKGITQTQVCTLPSNCDTKMDIRCTDPCSAIQIKEVALDSLETNAWFQLPDNIAITDMYLWVGDVKVKASLQDRAVASAQYEDIVKRRRDPALIETWGSGSYSLRIFPGQSGLTRKIEITFVQGMENNGDLFSTVLPIINTLASVYSPTITDYNAWPKRSIGAVNLKAVSLDGKAYNLQWDGLGKGTISATPLMLNAINVQELKEGVISMAGSTCRGCLDPWTAEKAGNAYFGVKALLDFKSLKLEPEPQERDIILDVDAADSITPVRASKLALLSLKAYVQSPYTGNLGLSDGKGQINWVFSKAVTMDAANLNTAYVALKAWKPIAKADSKAVLEAYAKARGLGSATCAAVLINNETYPYYPYPTVNDPITLTAYSKSSQAFEDAQKKIADELAAALNESHTILFGFWNNYRISTVAQTTGGYQLGGIYGWIYPPYRGGPEFIGDVAVSSVKSIEPTLIAPTNQWYMPPLFGAQRSDAYGVSNLTVKTSGVLIDNFVVLQDSYYGRYFGGDVMLMKSTALHKTSDVIAPYYWKAPESTTVRMAGQYHHSGKEIFTLSGTWGGLKFTQDFTADLPSTVGAGEIGSAIWANQQTEAWGRDYPTDHLTAMQKLGRDYHVVNRQMSLLALEPGVQLWADLPSKLGSTSGADASMPTSEKSALVAQGGANLDSASMEDILAGKVSGIQIPRATYFGNGEMNISRIADGMHISWFLPGYSEQAYFQILDISGRSLADITAHRIGDTFTADWTRARKSGIYYLRATSGATTITRKLISQP